MTALPPAKRGVSMVFQNYALFPHLSVAENILFGLRVRDVPRAERDARLKRAAGILGLDGLLERKPSQLSGGQQQRVALGRAIVAETRVCLMDEPLSNLDAQLRVEMRREIRALQRRLGMTMLYVTHDQVEAMTMADQVVLMRNGRIEQDAAPAALYEKPATIFAARFVGTPPMNVIPAALVPEHLAPTPHGRARDTLAIGIRPETAELATDGLPASVAAVEYLGADTLLDTRIGDQPFIVRVSGRANASIGDKVGIRWEAIRRALVRSVITASHRSIREAPSGRNIMDRRQFLSSTAALASAAIASPALAQTTEVSFFYPIAVGGPITRIIDGYAADFEKANPSIKVKPIYSGTYQESITKALTAHKSGTPPVTSVLLSTDMFTLIDEDAIVPINDFLKTDDDKKWMASFFPAFMANSQTGGKIWGVPFQRSTIVLYWNKDLFKEAGLDPEKGPATWAEMQAFAEKLTKRDASGNTTQWGVQIPSSGFPYWLFQGLTTPAGAILANEAGDKTAYDNPAVVEALQYWVDLSRKHKVHPPGIVEWGTTPKDFFERKVAMMWTTTGNLTNVKANAKFPFGVAMLPGAQAARLADRRRQFLHLQEGERRRAGGGIPVHQVDHDAGARRAVEHRYRLCGGAARRLCDRRDEEVCGGLPRSRGRARPARILGGGAFHPREPARHQGAQRRSAGGAHRHQAARAGDEGRAGRGGADLAAVSVRRAAAMHAPALILRSESRASGREGCAASSVHVAMPSRRAPHKRDAVSE